MIPKQIIGLCLISSFLIWFAQSPSLTTYIETIKEQKIVPIFANSISNQDPRIKIIKRGAKMRSIKPVDAMIDPIWKAIPGYEGREVDVAATIDETLKHKDKEIYWIYRKISPSKSLEDLGAAPIYRGNQQKMAAGIMVNVSWGTEFIEPMLNIFKKEKIKATFFLDGSWVKKNPTVAKQIIKEGHEVGNHAYSHPLLSRVAGDRIDREIKRTKDEISRVVGTHSRWFAPPAGDYNQYVVDIAHRQGLKTILWTVDTVDWRKSSTPTVMIKRVKDKITPGSLILTHPTDRTVKALPFIIKVINDAKLHIGTVSEVLSSERIIHPNRN